MIKDLESLPILLQEKGGINLIRIIYHLEQASMVPSSPTKAEGGVDLAVNIRDCHVGVRVLDLTVALPAGA